MPAEDKALVISDYESLGKLPIDGGGVRYFDQVFSGKDSQAVFSYVMERVRYVLPRFTDVIGRIRLDGQPVDAGTTEIEDDPRLGASNDGVWLWFVNVAEPGNLQLVFGDRLLDIESTRVGIITLGPGYTKSLPQLARVSVQVHEARHSDCTGGLPPSDVELLQAGEAPLTTSCGHSHVECPPGHEFAGLPACDDHAWGAYAVEMLFAEAVGSHCPKCTEEDRQIGMIIALDSSTRILVLKDMLEGRLGQPDMSSAGVREGV